LYPKPHESKSPSSATSAISMAASNGAIITAIQRYHSALANLSGRKWMREVPSAYEAAALVMGDMAESSRGIAYDKFPVAGSSAHFSAFSVPCILATMSGSYITRPT
jgi:hypothetical protein